MRAWSAKVIIEKVFLVGQVNSWRGTRWDSQGRFQPSLKILWSVFFKIFAKCKLNISPNQWMHCVHDEDLKCCMLQRAHLVEARVVILIFTYEPLPLPWPALSSPPWPALVPSYQQQLSQQAQLLFTVQPFTTSLISCPANNITITGLPLLLLVVSLHSSSSSPRED